MFAEEDLLPISALQHLVFCERQCALIHLEQIWGENLFTAKGRVLHERVDQGGDVFRNDVRIQYSLELCSYSVGLVGKADAVEFHRSPEKGEAWQPLPVEYKRGQSKRKDCDRVQLCAQAICLEEMMGLEIPIGALFYGKTRRREEVQFDVVLRAETKGAAHRLHELISKGLTPPPVYSKKCDSCSLVEQCLPKLCQGRRSVKRYLDDMIGGE
jgi:CRISPR-associated exonuclease Cas4